MDLRNDALTVAPQLLGATLLSRVGSQATGGIIVEVEVYQDHKDPASHAFRGPTSRTKPMFEAGGTIYVYLSYGIHTCMNIVTGPAGEGQAILIRALEPTIGIDTMSRRRLTSGPANLTSGPGKLTQALGITLGLSGSQLGPVISLTPPTTPPAPEQIIRGSRIGIRQARELPWRFYLARNPFVSGKRLP